MDDSVWRIWISLLSLKVQPLAKLSWISLVFYQYHNSKKYCLGHPIPWTSCFSGRWRFDSMSTLQVNKTNSRMLLTAIHLELTEKMASSPQRSCIMYHCRSHPDGWNKYQARLGNLTNVNSRTKPKPKSKKTITSLFACMRHWFFIIKHSLKKQIHSPFFTPLQSRKVEKCKLQNAKRLLIRVGFEPTPFRTSVLSQAYAWVP